MNFIKKIIILFSSDFNKKMRMIMEETDKERKALDERLSSVTRATLDGEDKWFLELVKKDPECALNVIKECNIDESDDA